MPLVKSKNFPEESFWIDDVGSEDEAREEIDRSANYFEHVEFLAIYKNGEIIDHSEDYTRDEIDQMRKDYGY